MSTTLGADERVQLVDDDEGERPKNCVEAMAAWFTNSDSIDSGVMSSTPEGCSSIRCFGAAETSPCHLCTAISASWQSTSSPRKLIVDQRLERPDVNRPDSR